MNGTRNNFVVVDGRIAPLDDPVAFARAVCDRERARRRRRAARAAVGGLDVRLRIINADGSEAEMCGNGMRCVARYLDEHDGRGDATVETLSGPIVTRVLSREPYLVSEMGEPRIGAPHDVAGYRATPVDVGNPHVVILVDESRAIDLATTARASTRSPLPERHERHFVPLDGDGWRVRHWERGAGATRACGTGAVRRGGADRERDARRRCRSTCRAARWT